jgi:general stress protein CsbA
MYAQSQRYRQVLGVGRDKSNWILSSQIAEAVFAGTWRSILIGCVAFSETCHTRVAMYLWNALQTHRVLQGYIELDFIAHSDAISVVVEHLIQTRVPITMRQDLKEEMTGLKSSGKEATNLLKKLESKMSRQAENIVRLLQDVQVLKK